MLENFSQHTLLFFLPHIRIIVSGKALVQIIWRIKNVKTRRENQKPEKAEEHFTRGIRELPGCVVSGGVKMGERKHSAGRNDDTRNRVVFRRFHRRAFRLQSV